MNTYTIRYESDGDLYVITFESDLEDAQQLVMYAAGMLFFYNCCPGSVWCLYVGDKRVAVATPDHFDYYLDDDSLWDEKSRNVAYIEYE